MATRDHQTERTGTTLTPSAATTSEGRHRENGGTSTAFERRLLATVMKSLGNPKYRIRLWDGCEIPENADHRVTLLINDRRAIWKLAADPTYQFGELYVDGRIDVDGNLVDFFSAVHSATSGLAQDSFLASTWPKLLHPPKRSSIAAARDNIYTHYDIGNEFYKLWLDDRLVYTCAYFRNEEMDLETAQVDKLDHVCRKLWLSPGDRVIEAGCGWGALAIHMATHYGVTVQAYNISHEQIAYARERAQREGIADRVEFVEDDWRNATGEFDVFVSVGMLEHVGLRNYGSLGDTIDKLLKPGGRGLIHTIAQDRPAPLNAWIESRIFPGAYTPALSEMTRIFEPHRFSILDLENLRLHYAKTLEHWLARFDAAEPTVREMFDERFVRTWRVYLAASIAAFQTGSLQLFQVVFNREGSNNIPWTRAYLYEDNKSPNQ